MTEPHAADRAAYEAAYKAFMQEGQEEAEVKDRQADAEALRRAPEYVQALLHSMQLERTQAAPWVEAIKDAVGASHPVVCQTLAHQVRCLAASVDLLRATGDISRSSHPISSRFPLMLRAAEEAIWLTFLAFNAHGATQALRQNIDAPLRVLLSRIGAEIMPGLVHYGLYQSAAASRKTLEGIAERHPEDQPAGAVDRDTDWVIAVHRRSRLSQLLRFGTDEGLLFMLSVGAAYEFAQAEARGPEFRKQIGHAPGLWETRRQVYALSMGGVTAAGAGLADVWQQHKAVLGGLAQQLPQFLDRLSAKASHWLQGPVVLPPQGSEQVLQALARFDADFPHATELMPAAALASVSGKPLSEVIEQLLGAGPATHQPLVRELRARGLLLGDDPATQAVLEAALARVFPGHLETALAQLRPDDKVPLFTGFHVPAPEGPALEQALQDIESAHPGARLHLQEAAEAQRLGLAPAPWTQSHVKAHGASAQAALIALHEGGILRLGRPATEQIAARILEDDAHPPTEASARDGAGRQRG